MLPFLIFLLFSSPSYPAFQGFGSTTPGGNHGTVVEVTSLRDSGPGTLRWALKGRGNRRIVFKVGGTIRLQKRLRIKEQSLITIDGSSAPHPGITLEGHGLLIWNSNNIIVSHLRIRNSLADGITIKNGSFNIVVDHCSLANSADENISITEGSHHVTVSWCIIGDSRPESLDPNAKGAKGMLIANFNRPAVTNVSIHHNLFANLSQRNPQVSTPGLVDIRNNVVRNWRSYGIRMRNGARGNIVHNLFESGKNPEKAVVLVSDQARAAGAVYIQGNQGPKGIDVNARSTATDPFPAPLISTESADEAGRKVLQEAGVSPRDPIDAFLANSAP